MYFTVSFYCCNKTPNRIVPKQKDSVFYSWIPLSPEVSRLSPYTHAQQHTRTSRTFYIFALPPTRYTSKQTLQCQCLCANCNQFEQTACGCHHEVLANHLLNLRTSHTWHEGMPSFNPGGRKDAVYTGYGGPTSSKFSRFLSAATSAIPGKAGHVQFA